MKIDAPWPDSKLMPNNAAGKHWSNTRKARDAYKQTGYCLAYGQTITGRHLVIELYPPDKRKRDTDNCLSALKNLLDGICLALKIDDSELNPVTVWKKEPVSGGKVTVIIE